VTNQDGWFYYVEGILQSGPVGPISSNELRTAAIKKSIKRETLVFHQRLTHGEWVNAEKVPAIGKVFDEREAAIAKAAASRKQKKAKVAPSVAAKFSYVCPHCMAKLECAETYLGKVMNCPFCHGPCQLPQTPPPKPSKVATVAKPILPALRDPDDLVTISNDARVSVRWSNEKERAEVIQILVEIARAASYELEVLEAQLRHHGATYQANNRATGPTWWHGFGKLGGAIRTGQVAAKLLNGYAHAAAALPAEKRRHHLEVVLLNIKYTMQQMGLDVR
jgi:hypothetical protein